MRTRPANLSVSDKRWLTKPEAMAYTNRRTEKTFDREIGCRVTRYNGGGRSFLYDKHELDRLIRSMVEMRPLPAEISL